MIIKNAISKKLWVHLRLEKFEDILHDNLIKVPFKKIFLTCYFKVATFQELGNMTVMYRVAVLLDTVKFN